MSLALFGAVTGTNGTFLCMRQRVDVGTQARTPQLRLHRSYATQHQMGQATRFLVAQSMSFKIAAPAMGFAMRGVRACVPTAEGRYKLHLAEPCSLNSALFDAKDGVSESSCRALHDGAARACIHAVCSTSRANEALRWCCFAFSPHQGAIRLTPRSNWAGLGWAPWYAPVR